MAFVIANGSDSVFGPAYSGPSRNFDFTLLFEDTILTIVPATIFVIAAGARATWLTTKPNKVSTSFSRLTKLVLLSAFATIQLTVLLSRATNLELATRASVAAAVLDFSAACLLFVLSCYEHSRSITPSTIIGLYLLLSLPFDAARLRTFYLLRGYAAKGIANSLALSLAIKFMVLITEAVEKRSILLEPYRDLPPETTSGIYSRSVFWWLNSLLRVGFAKTLHLNDLFNLDDTLLSANVQDRFRRRWALVKDHGRLSLLYTVLSVLKWQLLVSALPRLLLSVDMFAQPLLVQETINFLGSQGKQSVSVGWGLAGAYFLVYFAQAILKGAYKHLLNRCAVQVRGGLVSLLYHKTIDLSLAAPDRSGSLTLMSSDIQRIVDPIQYVHDTWGGIVDLGLGMYLLYRNLGSACSAAALVYVLLALGTMWVTRVISSFQKQWLAAIEVRVSFTSALLHSIRNVKLLGLSEVIKVRTQGLRETEIEKCKRFRLINNVQILLQNGPGTFAPFAVFLWYYIQAKGSGQPLDLATSFSALTILRLVQQPLNILFFVTPKLASSLSCFDRIQQYLLAPSRHDNRLSLDSVYDSDGYWDSTTDGIEMGRLGSISRSLANEALTLRNCSFGWTGDAPHVVQDIDLSIKAGTVTMIIGPIGSGKSTLLKGMLSETPLSRGFVYLRNQSISFADQEAWIQNGTIRDAIRGPDSRDISSFDDAWYEEVIYCCGLAEDLRAFPKGDKTLIGSRGISLSGGQKQRLALARAVFSKAEVLILDDVFSGLDNDTEELIFRRLLSQSGPLRRLQTTVIMVTHAVHRLPYADLVVSLDKDGRVSEQGSYAALVNSGNGYVRSLEVRFKQEHEALEMHEPQPEFDVGKPDSARVPAASLAEDGADAQNILRRTGEWSTYKHYFKSCGYVSTLLSFTWVGIWMFADATPGILVKFFANNSGQSTAFIAIFAAATGMAAVAIGLLGYQVFLDMQPRSSSHLHLNLLESVLNAPLSFFTRTDVGTIINRFSQDMAMVDNDMPYAYADTTIGFFSCIMSVALVASGTGLFAVVVPVVAVALYAVQKYYLRTSRQMRLLDLEEKAPLYTWFGETASGLASVRAFGWAEKFAGRNLELLDRSQRPFYLMFCIQRWLGIVLDLMVAIMVLILMVMVVTRRSSIEPGLVGLSLLSVVDLSESLTKVVRHWTELETSIGAITRLTDFVKTTESEHKPCEVQTVDRSWPQNGEVTFSSFGASYSAESALVLKNVGLQISAGEKLGLCGRSGSGKSSMLASLFHLLEFRSGAIVVDGVDLSRIPRETLRAKINVIPQEPWWVTTETVRFNMDPWNAANSEFDTPLERSQADQTFILALTQCQIWHIIEQKGGLDAVMTADFLSHGQRQLFCLARALVRKSKVVVLDEVSANVDVNTDKLMQQVIREHFHNCTIIAVAHRLNTIEDGDRVVVLSQGRIAEVGEPQVLLRTEASRFKELYET
ncbi:putative multidrug resistance-associated protein [Exophiala viscosa]|uniref:Multidrug resistance-associated protein n=1 Tax=Exophiala viscosa TaxID=2486360 RepID=A0AAN6DNP6_9EURO|nr:putative multidrug resistance-associated protein [Exophiala viscosa]KAI1620728.1 putative multidrug resistance-associated protein [Exophiala viscosa]